MYMNRALTLGNAAVLKVNIVGVDIHASSAVDVSPGNATMTTHRLPVADVFVEVAVSPAVSAIRAWKALLVRMATVDFSKYSDSKGSAVYFHISTVARVDGGHCSKRQMNDT